MKLLDFGFSRKAVSSPRPWTYLSSIAADSGEFEELREYVPGESSKRLDWVRSLGRNVPVVRSFSEEVDHSLVLVFDVGPSFRFSDGTGGKAELLIETAFLLIRSAWARSMSGEVHGLSRSVLPLPRNEAGLVTLRDAILRKIGETGSPPMGTSVPLMRSRDAFVVGLTDRAEFLAQVLAPLSRGNVPMIANIVHPKEREIAGNYDAVFTDGLETAPARRPFSVSNEPYSESGVPTIGLLVSVDPFRSLETLIRSACSL